MSKIGKVIALGSTSNETLVPITDAQFVQYPNSKLTTQVKNIRGSLEDADCVNVKDTLDVLTNMATDGTMPNIVTFATKAALDADEETRNNGTIAYVTETDEYFMLSEGTNIAEKEWSRLTNNVYYFGSFIDSLRGGQMTYEEWVKLNEIKNEYPIISYDRCIVIIQIADEGYHDFQESGAIIGGKKGGDIDTSVIDKAKTNKVHIRWYSLNENVVWDIYNEDVPNDWFEDDFVPSGTDTENDDYITVQIKSIINVNSDNFSDYTGRIRQDISNLQNDKANKAMIVNFTQDSQTGEFSADKSFSTIYAAFNEGTNIIGQWDSRTYTTFSVSDTSIHFYTLSAEEGVMSGLEIFSDEHVEHYVRNTIEDVDYSHLFHRVDLLDVYTGRTGTAVEGIVIDSDTYNNLQSNDRISYYKIFGKGFDDERADKYLVWTLDNVAPDGYVEVYFKKNDYTDVKDPNDERITNEYTKLCIEATYFQHVALNPNIPITYNAWLDCVNQQTNNIYNYSVESDYENIPEYGQNNYRRTLSNAIVFYDKADTLLSDSIIDTSRFSGSVSSANYDNNTGELTIVFSLSGGGTQTVTVDLSDIFDPTEYYKKDEINSKLAAVSHYNATWLISNDGNAEDLTYEYTISHTRYTELVAAINANKLIFAKTSSKEVYFNVFTDNNDYILMQFIQNNRRMNYHVYRTNNDGVHTVQKRRADFAYNDNVYSKQDVYTKSETDDKFVGSLVVRLASASISDGTTFQTVYDALLAGKHVVYVNNGSQYYTVERFDSTAIHLKSFSIYSDEWLFVIDNLVHTPDNDNDPRLQYYYKLLPTVQHLSARTQSNEGASSIGYYSGGNTYITNTNTVSAALGKVDALISTINQNITSTGSTLSEQMKTFRVGINGSDLYGWNSEDEEWQQYGVVGEAFENEDAYNDIATAIEEGRNVELFEFASANNQYNGNIYRLQYYNATGIPTPSGMIGMSSFNMLFNCNKAIVIDGNNNTEIKNIDVYLNPNQVWTVVEANPSPYNP